MSIENWKQLAGNGVPSDPIEDARIALGAVSVLRKHGWIQNDLFRSSGGRTNNRGIRGPVCAVGALGRAMGIHALAETTAEESWALTCLSGRIAKAAGLKFSLPHWNDLYAQSVDDVILVLEQAAANLKGASDASAE